MVERVNWNVDSNFYDNINDKSTQEKLSIFLARFFNIHDLTYICEDLLKKNIEEFRDINEEYDDIYRYSNFDVSIEIKDILVIDVYPAVRFIEISIMDLLVFNTYVFRYLYTTSIYEILNKIVTDAYNFSMYCSDQLDNEKIDRSYIYKIYAESIDTIFKLDYNDYNYIHTKKFKYMLNEFIKFNVFNRKHRYIKVFELSKNIECEVLAVTDHIEKLSIYLKGSPSKASIYLDRLYTGKGQMMLIIDFLRKINNNNQ